jgi:hypothetical protein
MGASCSRQHSDTTACGTPSPLMRRRRPWRTAPAAGPSRTLSWCCAAHRVPAVNAGSKTYSGPRQWPAHSLAARLLASSCPAPAGITCPDPAAAPSRQTQPRCLAAADHAQQLFTACGVTRNRLAPLGHQGCCTPAQPGASVARRFTGSGLQTLPKPYNTCSTGAARLPGAPTVLLGEQRCRNPRDACSMRTGALQRLLLCLATCTP